MEILLIEIMHIEAHGKVSVTSCWLRLNVKVISLFLNR